MHIATWNKYLPIIRILLKRSIITEQSLDLNSIDFERAGSGRKAGYKFLIEFRKARVGNVISGIPLAANLASVIMEDAAAKAILANNDYHISLNPKFKLHIKCINREALPAAGPDGETKSEVPAP